jgi:hypothetical protein
MPLATLGLQFLSSDSVKRDNSVITSFIRFYFDSHQRRVSSSAGDSSQKFKIPPMLWSLTNKAWVLHNGVNERHAERVIVGMIDLNMPVCLTAEAREPRPQFGSDGSVDCFHGEIAENNGRKIFRHLAKIPAILGQRHGDLHDSITTNGNCVTAIPEPGPLAR